MILVRFLLHGNIETHDRLIMTSDLENTGVINQDLVEMRKDMKLLNWDFHGEP